MSNNYKFSIVIAIFNMENYLVEAIDSLVNQTIGFEDNLQVLLVNDGSIDNSETICKSYVEKYPDNMVYIWKENGGVSDARNKGLEYATGELVNFLDADDKFEVDALEKVYTFYAEHKEEVDLISIPLCFFEGEEGEHLLNYKFYSTRVIDIFNEPNCFQMHISSSFIRLQEMKKYIFNSKLKFGEDAEVANKIILNKGKYGVISDTKYMYRKRNAGNSVIQGARANKENYLSPLKYLHLELIEFAKEKYNKVPEYLQYLLIYDLGWKIRVPIIAPSVLDQAEIEEFIHYAKQILSSIDDEIILAGFNTKRYYNLYLLTIKLQDISKDKLTLISNKEDAVLCYHNSIVDMLYKQTICIENIELQDNIMKLSGSFNSLFDQNNVKFVIDISGKETDVLYQKNENFRVTSLNQFVAEGYEFHIDIPLDSKETILKAKAKLNDTKTQIKFMLKQELVVNDTNLDSIIIGDYRISNKNKSLVIKKNNLVPSDEKNTNINENKELSKKISNSIIIYTKSIIKKLSLHCSYYLTSNLKSDKENEVKAVTTYNQACIYNNDNLLLGKLTDIKVNVEQYKIEKDHFIINGTIASPFKANMYQFRCICNKQKFDGELKRNPKRTLRLIRERMIECYEYEVRFPIADKNEIYYEFSMGVANVIPQLNIDEEKLTKIAKKSGYMVNIVDKKKIELFY